MSDPIAIVNTPGGPATAANPPVEATLVIPDPDNPGGWIPDPGGGGGGSGTVQSVAGVAPDEEGNVPLTHSDLGPIQVGDLGFDPETEEEMDAELATINAAIATKAPQSTTYTKTQVDALAAALKVKPYSAVATYAAGDVAVSPSGDLVRSIGAISPAAAASYVGVSSVSLTGSSGTLPLPAGAAAGDVVVLIASDYFIEALPTFAGFASVGTLAGGSGQQQTTVFTKALSGAEVTAGTIAWSGFTGKNVAVIAHAIRNTSSAAVATLSAVATPAQGATVQAASFTPSAAGSVFLSFASFIGPANATATANGSVSGVLDPTTRLSPSPGGAYPHVVSSGHRDTPPAGVGIAAGWATYTVPTFSSAATVPTIVGRVEVPLTSGYNPAQWTVLVKGDTTPASDAAAATPSLRSLGTGAGQAAAGNDSRLSDTRTPIDASVTLAKTHAAIRQSGLDSGTGATTAQTLRRLGDTANDAAPGDVTVTRLAAKADTTTLNARISAAQRTAINALDAGTATVADVVNALKA